MYKMIITEHNIYDIVGRLRKFFSCCHNSGMYDIQAIEIKRENDMKKIKPYDWTGGTYYSYPDEYQKDNINILIDLVKNVDNKEEISMLIYIRYPVKTYLRIGDIIYFDGYRIFIRTKRKDNTLYNIIDAYIKCINPNVCYLSN